MESNILLISTPVWAGHPSSITQRVLERLDAELSASDDAGRPSLGRALKSAQHPPYQLARRA